MIGRGLLKDPFLAMRIKSLSIASDTGKILRDFHDAVEEGYRQFLTPSHLLDKMTAFWSYFADCFPNSDKVFKKIKKSRQYSAYSKAVDSAFQTIDTP
jgi:tRNA-dihydrouridine synthase